MTLTEFLLARIAEDEADGPRHRAWCWSVIDGGEWGCDCDGATRGKAECEAKRRIVEEHRNPEGTDWCLRCVEHDGTDAPYPCPTLHYLALPYADHPDYREEWRP